MSIFDPFANAGMVIAFLLGKYLDYADQAKFLLIPTIVFMILFAGIPESPAHLLKVNKQNVKHKQAKKLRRILLLIYRMIFFVSQAANKANKFFKGREIESLPVKDDGKHMVDDSTVTLADLSEWMCFENVLNVL